MAGHQTAQGSFFADGSHTSWRGAVKADQSRLLKTRRYLLLLASKGPLTDWEAAHMLCCERTSINSIRAALMKAGLVTRGFTTRPGPDGVTPNSVWQLTREGGEAVRKMRQETR
jgi:hypothetical protein